MVVAGIALLVALSGTGIAAVQATAPPSNSVGTSQLKNNAVTAAKIASNAVTAAKIATNGVSNAEIANNAVGNKKIAGDAVTTDKVKNGTLVAKDFKSGELPPATAGFARFLDGPVVVPTASALIASLTIPNAGNFLVYGKAYVTATAATLVTCRLQAEGDFDQSEASAGAAAPQSMALSVAHVFSAAGTVELRCAGSVAGGAANFVKLSAIQVASLTNSG
jgi:hypothetical protein